MIFFIGPTFFRRLYKGRLKLAAKSPLTFIPSLVFAKFPTLTRNYQAIIDYDILNNDNAIDENTITSTINTLKDLLIHVIVVSQENNWILVTQVEVYYKDIQLDNVAIVSDKYDNTYPEKLATNLGDFNEGRGIWNELRFNYRKFEVVVTGGVSFDRGSECLVPFLGVSAPLHIAHDTRFILFSPTEVTETIACTRMLRNYMKAASMKPWCIKSAFFHNIGFSTPLPLKFHESMDVGYTYISSKLIDHSANNTYNEEVFNSLRQDLYETRFWEDIGFARKTKNANSVIKKLDEIEKIKDVKK